MNYTGWSINTGFLDGNLVPNDGYHYDEEALARHYGEALDAAIVPAFPGADITIRHQPGQGTVPFNCQTRADHDDMEDLDRLAQADEIVARIDDIHGEVYGAIDWDAFPA